MKNLYIDVKNQSTGGGTVIIDEWVRPDDWLALPVLAEGDQKFVGLHAVYGDSDFVSVLCAGNYSVDWGDGTVENVAANTKRDHLFSYAALAGTECSRGYRQAIVTITPQAGQLLTLVNLQQKHSQAGLSSYRTQWLDIAIVGSSLSTLSIGGNSMNNGMLEQATYIGVNSIISMSNMFYGCTSLQSIPQLYSGLATVFRSMFQGCYSLKHGPSLDTSQGNDFTSMFNLCTGMLSIPLYNTSEGTNFSSMFSNCYSLPTIPAINTSKGTNFSSMFLGCHSLLYLPLIDLLHSTSCINMLTGCECIGELPEFDITNVSGLSGMLGSCYSLQRVRFKNISYTISFFNCKLSALELEQIFNNLKVVSTQIITVTGNWGAAYLTDTQKAIATNKGWTLVL